MPAFAYAALGSDGSLRSGRIDADDRPAALRLLESQGLVPTRVDDAVDRQHGAGARSLPMVQLLGFARSLSGLLAAGVPLSRALTVIERETSHPAARATWSAVHARVRDGSSLADAVANETDRVPPALIAMVRAGEAGGFLPAVLEQVADYLERSRELANRVGTALIYPTLLSLIAGGVVTFLLVWFIPRFAEVFASFHRELPLLTRLIQAASHALVHWGWLLVLLIGASAIAVRMALLRPAGAVWWDRTRLRLPGIGAVRATFARVRFCRMLGTLLNAGVPLLTALGVAREAVGSPTLAALLADAGEQIRQGTSLTKALATMPDLLPPTALEALAVAEDAGRLGPELLRLADTGERDLDRRLRTLVALAEPLLLLLMATVVGTIVIGMLLPVFDLWSAIA